MARIGAPSLMAWEPAKSSRQRRRVPLRDRVIDAFRALHLSTGENERLRAERRAQPRRQHPLEVLHELKEMAAQVEVVVPGVGYFDTSALAARKQRLQVALEFFEPDELPLTRAAADPHDLTQAAARKAVAPAAAELADELARLEQSFVD